MKVDDLLRPKYSSKGRKQVIQDMLGWENLDGCAPAVAYER